MLGYTNLYTYRNTILHDINILNQKVTIDDMIQAKSIPQNWRIATIKPKNNKKDIIVNIIKNGPFPFRLFASLKTDVLYKSHSTFDLLQLKYIYCDRPKLLWYQNT